MMRAKGGGRKPTPTALRLLRGNPTKRAFNRFEPPTEPLQQMSAPAWLAGEQLAKWHDVTRELADAGMLSTAYRDVITVYCVAWARWRTALQKLVEFGDLIKAPRSGLAIPSPYLGIANKAQHDMLQAQAEMGLTPTSRTRVKVSGGQKSKLEKFLSGKTAKRA